MDAPDLPPASPTIFRAFSAQRPKVIVDPAPYLGLVYLSVATNNREAMQTGIVVASVESGSPAAEAGIRPGDTLLALNGKVVHRGDSLLETLRGYLPGQVIPLTISRSGASWDVSVRLISQAARRS